MIRLCEPTFDDADRARVLDVLATGQLVQGAYVARLEAALARHLAQPVAVCGSGTAALALALRAVGVGPGTDVVVPGFTWPSVANVVLSLGATLRVVDIDAASLNFDPDTMLGAVGPATRAVVPIHQFGIPAQVAPLVHALRGTDVRVVEDAACALGTVCEGSAWAGTIGDIGCFSFHPRKIVTTGEGGAVTTADAALDQRLRVLRNHGQDPTRGLERFVDVGLNDRMPEVSAALGIGQVDALSATLAARRELGAAYIDSLDGLRSLRVPAGVRAPGNNFQSFVVELADPARRDAWMAALADAGVQTTIGTYALAAQPTFQAVGVAPHTTPNAMRAMASLVTLPLHGGMTTADVARVVDTIRQVEQRW
jgi:perosamine synthetase